MPSSTPDLSLDPGAPTLPLVLDAPLQSWGHQSQFTRRNTLNFPTFSGLIGLIAAAAGIDRESADQTERIAALTELRIMTCRISRWKGRSPWRQSPVLTDFHTVEGPRVASGKLKTMELTHRNYLQNHRFIVLLQGTPSLLESVLTALRNPVWGGWLGRKCCLPALPLLPPGDLPAQDMDNAWQSAVASLSFSSHHESLPSNWSECDRQITTNATTPGSDTLLDVPLSFGKNRQYTTRRIDTLWTKTDAPPSPLD